MKLRLGITTEWNELSVDVPPKKSWPLIHLFEQDRAFSVMAPTWWNALSEETRALRDLSTINATNFLMPIALVCCLPSFKLDFIGIVVLLLLLYCYAVSCPNLHFGGWMG
ncbi:UNVERIFIED_CONTAM: hypothetical protein K2H54_058539 [Gekko kuhli]